MKLKLLLMTLATATFAAQLLVAGTCIKKVGSTEVTSEVVATEFLKKASLADSASSASGASALAGGAAFSSSSLSAALEGGIAVWDYSNVADYDFTPGGGVFVIW